MKSKREKLPFNRAAGQKIGSAPLKLPGAGARQNKPAGIFLHQILNFIQKGRNALNLVDENRFNPFVLYFLHGLLTEPGRIFRIGEKNVAQQ